MADRKSFWAWCLESEEPSDADRAALAAKLSKRYGTEIIAKPVPSLGDAELRAPRIAVPDSVVAWCSTTTYDRARYAYGAHFTERVRAFNLDFPNPPDVVAHPSNETEVEATLDWCDANGYVTVPYGGGSSVVWGVTPHDDLGPTVVISLDRLDRVLEIDEVSRAARIQAGVFGPHLEDQPAAQRPHPATLSSVLPVLHPRGLDRHPLRRPLRHQPHPHRRLRGVGADDHPGGLVGVAPPARFPVPVPALTGWLWAPKGSTGSSPRPG